LPCFTISVEDDASVGRFVFVPVVDSAAAVVLLLLLIVLLMVEVIAVVLAAFVVDWSYKNNSCLRSVS